MRHIIILSISILFIFSCTVNQLTPGSDNLVSSGKNETQSTYADLTELMRTVPGVSVSGARENATIRIKRNSISSSGGSPLFVVDEIEFGYDYTQVYEMIDINSIESVRPLRDLYSTSKYGTRGENGVIEIFTK